MNTDRRLRPLADELSLPPDNNDKAIGDSNFALLLPLPAAVSQARSHLPPGIQLASLDGHVMPPPLRNPSKPACYTIFVPLGNTHGTPYDTL